VDFSKYCLFKLHGRHARYLQLSNNMASQKHWQEHIEYSDSIELGSDTEEDLLTKEEAETIFRQECREWIKSNQKELLNSPFKTAYKRPWTKKSSSAAFLTQTNSEKDGKTVENKFPTPEYYIKNLGTELK